LRAFSDKGACLWMAWNGEATFAFEVSAFLRPERRRWKEIRNAGQVLGRGGRMAGSEPFSAYNEPSREEMISGSLFFFCRVDELTKLTASQGVRLPSQDRRTHLCSPGSTEAHRPYQREAFGCAGFHEIWRHWGKARRRQIYHDWDPGGLEFQGSGSSADTGRECCAHDAACRFMTLQVLDNFDVTYSNHMSGKGNAVAPADDPRNKRKVEEIVKNCPITVSFMRTSQNLG